MKYGSSHAFRQALVDRLHRDYPHHQIPRLRKMNAFERFMTRLSDDWILKGGYADLDEAIEAAKLFVDPVLQTDAEGWWNPTTWRWQL